MRFFAKSLALVPVLASLGLADDDSDSFPSPPYYPSPKGGWLPTWAEAYEKAHALVSQMTLAEKVNLTSGTGIFMGPCSGQSGSASRLGVPQLCYQDSALGIRNGDHSTMFPAGITVGATFDKKLMYERGAALGEEARNKGVHVQLGPVVGPLGRKPRGGRNWEGFGADPALQAIGGAETIKGMQDAGTIASLKHLVGNEQEMHRMTLIVVKAYSSNIDDRTMHEMYLWPFAEGVRAGAGSVMIGYNDLNSSACSQNSLLLNGLLKDELGFQGFVVSDWLAQQSGVDSALAGLDVSMPGDGGIPLLGDSYWGSELSRSVLNGSVPVDRLNDMVTRVIATWYKMGQDKDHPEVNFSSNTDEETGLLYPGAVASPSGVVNKFVDVQANHSVTAKAVARDAITLLKNENQTLPLRRSDTLKVFGTDAGPNTKGLNGCSDAGCDNGVLVTGWGSGAAHLPYLNTPQEGISNATENVDFYLTDSFPSDVKANQDDIALVFINSDSGENYITVEGNPGDRTLAGLNAWHKGDDLVKAAAEKFSQVVVIVHTVGPILMEEWIDLEPVKAVLVAHLPGQEAGDSLADVLFGDHSPSGHLPYTIPRSESDYPSSTDLIDQPFGQIQDTFTEGLYIDYRHFNKANIKPRFPFGHGLSYTTFNFTASISSVTHLDSEYPSARASKGSTPTYNTSIPAASEVAWPKNFNRIWRYLYPYLDKPSEAAANQTKTYPYPEGYTTKEHPAPRAGGAEGGNPALWDVAFSVQVQITNSGSRPGRAVPQLYVELPESLGAETPRLQLRQFEKTKILAPGQSETVTLDVTRKDVSVWDVVTQDWKAPVRAEGVKVWVGESVAAMRVSCEAGKSCSTV